jgi:GTPase SAR1 family protein
MPKQVVLLSGPVASGKTTLVQALVEKYAFHPFKTRQLIQAVKNVKSERRALQRAGDVLDRQTDGKVDIGTPTRGAIGEVTNTVLPGGVQVNFAAEERRRADGRPVQDVGIVPEVWAPPTISGIREGRDEVLEKAIEFLKTSDAVAKQ